jgi:hypothetical protein
MLDSKGSAPFAQCPGSGSGSSLLDSAAGLYSDSAFVNNYLCSFQYHLPHPTFSEEIKINLPTVLTRKMHILFTFYHIGFKATQPEKKKPDKTLIARAILPLPDYNETFLHSKRFHLRLFLNLPEREYLNVAQSLDYLLTTTQEDQSKLYFHVNYRFASSRYPRNYNLLRFIGESCSTRAPMVMCKSLVYLKDIGYCVSRDVLSFAPLIFRILLKMNHSFYNLSTSLAVETTDFELSAFYMLMYFVNVVVEEYFGRLKLINDRRNAQASLTRDSKDRVVLVKFLAYRRLGIRNSESLYYTHSSEYNPVLKCFVDNLVDNYVDNDGNRSLLFLSLFTAFTKFLEEICKKIEKKNYFGEATRSGFLRHIFAFSEGMVYPSFTVASLYYSWFILAIIFKSLCLYYGRCNMMREATNGKCVVCTVEVFFFFFFIYLNIRNRLHLI